MATLDAQEANQIANIEKATGRSLDEWIAIVRASGLEKHAQILAMLKEQHGLTHGNANLIALKARAAMAGGELSDADVIAGQYSGKNAPLRPLYDAAVAEVEKLGTDVELDAKKTYVSLRRRKQFGQLGPAAGQLEVGVNLPGKEATERLRPTTGMATHRVRISETSELDEELIGWLREAYERA